VSQRRAVAHWWLLGRIHRAGIADASLEVEAVSAGALSLARLRLGAPPALEIARLAARYSAAGLWRGYLDELLVSGLRLRGSLDDDGLSLGALDALLEGDSEGAGSLPARKIAVADARAEIQAPGGTVTLPFEVEVDEVGTGRLEGEARFEVHHPLVKGSGRASITGAPDDFEGTLSILGSSLEIPNLRVDSDLRADASFRLREGRIGYQLKLANAGESLVLEAKGSADPSAPSARATLHLHPLVFDPAGLQPAALFPFLEGQIDDAQGSVEAAGTAEWDGVGITAKVDLALREIGFAAEAAEVSNLNGRIEIGGPFPPATPPGQLISIALIDAGLQLTDGLIEFRLRPDGQLELQEAKWRWAGGAVRTAGLFDPTADSQEAVLEVEGVELAELLALIDLDGLEGSGTLEGEIPVFRSGETVEIRNGELRGGPEGGRIRYRPAAGVEGALASQGYGMEQLLGALHDFHYDVLRLTVDGDARGAVEVAIHLGGSNPNYQRGRRVEFSLNVEARLADLLRAGLVSYRVPETIEQRLEEFRAPEVQ